MLYEAYEYEALTKLKVDIRWSDDNLDLIINF